MGQRRRRDDYDDYDDEDYRPKKRPFAGVPPAAWLLIIPGALGAFAILFFMAASAIGPMVASPLPTPTIVVDEEVAKAGVQIGPWQVTNRSTLTTTITTTQKPMKDWGGGADWVSLKATHYLPDGAKAADQPQLNHANLNPGESGQVTLTVFGSGGVRGVGKLVISLR